MTEFIARNDNFRYYAYNEITPEHDIRIKNNEDFLYCIGCSGRQKWRCGSGPFNTKYSTNVYRRAGFYHLDGKCTVDKCNNNDSNEIYYDVFTGEGATEFSKRRRALKFLISRVKNSYDNYKKSKNQITEIEKEALKYEVLYQNYMNSYIMTIYNSNTTMIGFKDIEYLEPNNGTKIYLIGDGECISKSLINNIIGDEERFIRFIKNLSLISTYYSICNKADKIEQETNEYVLKIKNEIKIKKLSRFIPDD